MGFALTRRAVENGGLRGSGPLRDGVEQTYPDHPRPKLVYPFEHGVKPFDSGSNALH